MNLYTLAGPWPGALSIAARPRGGEWLADDLAALRSAGVNTLVSTLTPNEQRELGLGEEQALARHAELEYVAFPVEDRSVPASAADTSAFVERLQEELVRGHNVAIHCRAGIGRSAIVAAAVLGMSGVDVDVALAQIEQARGLAVPDTTEQADWVRSFVMTASHAARRAS